MSLGLRPHVGGSKLNIIGRLNRILRLGTEGGNFESLIALKSRRRIFALLSVGKAGVHREFESRSSFLARSTQRPRIKVDFDRGKLGLHSDGGSFERCLIDQALSARRAIWPELR